MRFANLRSGFGPRCACEAGLIDRFGIALNLGQADVAADRAISCGVQLVSARRRHAAFRKPCAEHSRGWPASLHHARNLLPDPALLNGTPASVRENVKLPGALRRGLQRA